MKPATLAFNIKILNGKEWKTDKLTALEYFKNKFPKEDESDNSSINNKDTIELNNVKTNVCSENIVQFVMTQWR